MLGRLLLLFVTVPLVELYLLYRLARVTSFGMTVAIVILTGVVGSVLVRWQGLTTLRRIQEDLQAGRMPGDRILSGLLILLGGAFLLTPGILTDAVGFLLMVPGNRRLLIRHLKASFQESLESGEGGQVFFFRTGGPAAPPPASNDADTITVQSEPLDD